MNQNFTLITGASNGLGKEIAIECARRKKNVALVSLPGRNLNKLCQQLEETYKIRAICFETDLTETDSIYEIVSWAKKNIEVDFLINNAGVGGSNPFEDASPSEMDHLIQLNIKAIVILTRLMIPLLREHRRSYILNVASIAALSPLPYKVVYAASKAFIVSFSRGLREELKDSQIKISVLLPGPMLTNPDIITRVMNQGFMAWLILLSPGEVSKIALNSVYKGKAIIIPGFMNKLNISFGGLLPINWRLNILSRIMQNEFLPQHTLRY